MRILRATCPDFQENTLPKLNRNQTVGCNVERLLEGLPEPLRLNLELQDVITKEGDGYCLPGVVPTL